MEWIFIVVIVAFFVWKMMPSKGVKSISTAELKNVLNDQDKVFVDVEHLLSIKVEILNNLKIYH